MGLSCGVICVILRLVVLIQYWSVTDIHRHTTKAYTTLSIVSCGKKMYYRIFLVNTDEWIVLLLGFVYGEGKIW